MAPGPVALSLDEAPCRSAPDSCALGTRFGGISRRFPRRGRVQLKSLWRSGNGLEENRISFSI